MSLTIILFTLSSNLITILTSASTLWIDCHPDPNATLDRCKARGCIWSPKSIPGAPWCEFSTDLSTMAGYDANASVIESPGQNYLAKLNRRSTPTLFGDDFQRAVVRIEQLTDEILKITIVDQQETARRALLPNWKANLYENTLDDAPSKNAPFDIQIEDAPFGFAILRRSSKVALIDTRRIPGFSLARQYLQISTRVPSQFVYGLGDFTHTNLTQDFNYKRWGLFAKDHAPGWDDVGLYGSHPFYICIDDDVGNTHGIFFLNTHAINVALQPDPDNPKGGIITWRAIGGIFEFFVFSGPTLNNVLSQYTSIIGRPNLPPYWSLGFQLCRYGYRNLTFLDTIFQRNRDAQIPQDVQYIDIDYMYEYMDFTRDPVNFANLSAFIQKLHDTYNMKLVLITDPAIASRPSVSYAPLTSGLQMDIFVKDNRTGQPLEGKVWPGYTYYPDFTHPNVTKWWTEWMIDFHNHQNVQFDGLWIDMNEPANFVSGCVGNCVWNKFNKPPYNPLEYIDMNENTICMDADQYLGKHYELHNLYGFTEAIATYEALKTVFPGKRPFILSRSTFPGSGKYTNHWTGDNRSQWPHMKMSIIATLEYNFFALPMVGADICGFGDEANEEMCVRWQQLGAFYPFSRNHNDYGSSVEQDPAAWSEKATNIIRSALTLRYGFLPYLYTLFYEASTNGVPVARPLFGDYAYDRIARLVDDQFLWGSALMIAPIINQGSTKRWVYFPKGRWYDFIRNTTEIPNSNVARRLNMDLPLDTIGLYIRGGYAIPWQTPATNTIESRKREFTLYVALDENSQSIGSLYSDDGESLKAKYSLVEFQIWHKINQGGIHVQMQSKKYPIEPALNYVYVQGMQSKPKSATVDGKSLSTGDLDYDSDIKVLRLLQLGMKLDRDHEIEWQF